MSFLPYIPTQIVECMINNALIDGLTKLDNGSAADTTPYQLYLMRQQMANNTNQLPSINPSPVVRPSRICPPNIDNWGNWNG